MKYAFHLTGGGIPTFTSLCDSPKAVFFEGRAAPPPGNDPLGAVTAVPEPPPWPGLAFVCYRDNSARSVPGLITVHYGDVRKMARDGRVAVTCDIMDESFWYYFDALVPTGVFTFSVNTDACDPSVYRSTVRSLGEVATPTTYRDLAW